MILTGTFYLVAESERLWIGVNPETVSLDANNVQAAPLQVRFWAGEGSNKVAMSAYLTFRVESVVGSSVTKLFEDKPEAKVSSYDYTIPPDKYATANRISIYAYEDAGRTKEIDSKQVSIVAANPTPFPRSEDWNVANVYKNGEYLKQDNVLYMWTSRVSGNTEISPKEWIEAHQESGLWTPYPYDKLIAAGIALFDFALIGSAVFKDEYMYSQQGVDAAGADTSDYRQFGKGDFTPNFLVNFLNGRVDANLCFLRASLYTPFKLLQPNANDVVYADFSTGFNLDIGRLISTPTDDSILYLPSALAYSGAICYLYNSCSAYTRSAAPCLVKIDGNGQFLNLYNPTGGNNAITIRIPAKKKLRLSAVESRDMDGNVGAVYWYIDNPEDCEAVSYAPNL